jgi:CRISPR-associated protein Cmr6
MTQSRYSLLQGVRVHSTTHAGLWLDKYIDLSETEQTPQARLVQEVSEEINTPDIYTTFFDRWSKALEDSGAVLKEAQVQGRLAINLGAEAVLETSIALHHTYGVPYIPGSAMKGLAAHYAHSQLDGNHWKKTSPAYTILFGDTSNAGYVTFFDALYVPGSGHKQKALWPDIITVHHPDYYQASSNPPPPADWDNPTPIPFLSATGRYLIALKGPTEWVEKAFEILGLALENEGIGAKTSSGYGRMIFVEPSVSIESYLDVKRKLLGETPSIGRHRGTVAEIRENGRFGFINPARGGARMFVHSNQIRGAQKAFAEGQVVEYRVGQYKGKEQAQDVDILLEPGS